MIMLYHERLILVRSVHGSVGIKSLQGIMKPLTEMSATSHLGEQQDDQLVIVDEEGCLLLARRVEAG